MGGQGGEWRGEAEGSGVEHFFLGGGVVVVGGGSLISQREDPCVDF